MAPLEAALVILAGGASRRMGRAKYALPVGGVTLLEWQVARLAPAFAETIVVGAPAPGGARGVPDLRPDAGPVAGIESGLLAMTRPSAFVLSCDAARATTGLAAALLARVPGRDAVVPRVGGRTQPTVAAYVRACVPKVTAYLDRGGRRATDLLDELDVAYLLDDELARAGIPPSELSDLDTPDDYEAFLAEIRS